jgi:hypothetical protein
MSIPLIKSAFESGDLIFRHKTTGTEVAAITTTGFRAAAVNFTSLAELSFGAAEEVTIASGVATVTKSYVRLTSESGTSDQLDTITKADATDGDILVLIPKATDTITVDDANIDLGAATRAVAPGGVIVLLYNGAIPSWQEVVFLAASDNV